MTEGKKITRQDIIPLICIAAWVVILNAIIFIYQIPHTWTMFMAVVLFFLMGANKKCLPEIFIGGLVGMGSTWLLIMAATALTPIVGPLAGFVIPLAIIVFAVIILNPFVPVVFNNVAFAFLIISAINLDKVLANTLPYMVVFLIGGAVVIGGCMIMLRIITAIATKKQSAAGK